MKIQKYVCVFSIPFSWVKRTNLGLIFRSSLHGNQTTQSFSNHACVYVCMYVSTLRFSVLVEFLVCSCFVCAWWDQGWMYALGILRVYQTRATFTRRREPQRTSRFSPNVTLFRHDPSARQHSQRPTWIYVTGNGKANTIPQNMSRSSGFVTRPQTGTWMRPSLTLMGTRW